MLMADKLSITIAYVEDKYEVTAFMTETSILPAAIFLYENNGTTVLGEYQGVCGIDELSSRQVWTGDVIPTFGNKFVRHTHALVIAPSMEEAEKSRAWIISNVNRLKEQILSQESITQVLTI